MELICDCELVDGPSDVSVIGVGESPFYFRIAVMTRHVRSRRDRYGRGVHRHGIEEVELADLSCFGRRPWLLWRKRRSLCPNPGCQVETFTETDVRLAASAAAIADLVGRWSTF
jgi:transposase